MYTKSAVVKNATGLHARPASEFVSAANKFASKITIRRTDGAGAGVNAKSIVLLLSQGLSQNEEVEITAKGEDEVPAVDTLIALIESGFGE